MALNYVDDSSRCAWSRNRAQHRRAQLDILVRPAREQGGVTQEVSMLRGWRVSPGHDLRVGLLVRVVLHRLGLWL